MFFDVGARSVAMTLTEYLDDSLPAGVAHAPGHMSRRTFTPRRDEACNLTVCTCV
jgi:hypothetical protein